MSEQEDVEEVCRSVMEHGLLLSEGIESLVSDFEGDSIETEMIETVRTMLKNCEDKMRYKRISILAVNVGSRLGSQRLVDYGKKHLQMWNDKYGG